jgi:DNA-binding GntR family transcriptional regulator
LTINDLPCQHFRSFLRRGHARMTSAVNLRLPKRRLDNQAADVLREQILSGRFAPGLRLVEATLADQLGVSRGTVRAALSELAHEGLVSQVAYTKWMVPELSATDAWELYSLRGSLEGLAARLATERRTPESMKLLREAYERLDAAVAAERRGPVAAADLALHKTIVAITGHRRLIGQYKLIEQQVRHYIGTSNADIVDLHELLDQHQPIVRAIAEGDAARAERLAHDHNAPEVEKFAAELAHASDRHGEVLPLPARPRRGRSSTEEPNQGGKK